MKLGKSVFDSDFESIVFSLNKPTTWVRASSMLASLETYIANEAGECGEACVPMECTGGPGSGCFQDPRECSCFDEGYGDDGRCQKGAWCNLLDGLECADCCLSDYDTDQACRYDYRRKSPSTVGPFTADDVCDRSPPAEFMANAVGTACPTCKTGKCTWDDVDLGDITGWYYCVPNVTKELCKSLTSKAKFECCKGASNNCDCNKECPSGQPKEACKTNEYFMHKEGSWGGDDTCFCKCKAAFRVENSDKGDLCVECGAHSTFRKSGVECVCDEGYETPAGDTKWYAGSFTIGTNEGSPGNPVAGTDGFAYATSPPCVKKRYKCDDSFATPRCVFVPRSTLPNGDTLYDGEDACKEAGCGRYKCDSAADPPACIHDVNPEASGNFATKQACIDAGCLKFACVDDACVQDNDGAFDNKKACEDTGCGQKWFCNGDGACKRKSAAEVPPDGVVMYDDEQACKDAGCGKYYCDGEGVCKQFAALNVGKADFADQAECNNSGCGKYYCKDAENQCYLAKGDEAKGKDPYYASNTDCMKQCYCSENPVPWAQNAWGVTPPDPDSPCSAYTAFFADIKEACEDVKFVCKESLAGGSYVACTGGQKGCVQQRTYVYDEEKAKTEGSACRRQLYWLSNSASISPSEVYTCVFTNKENAVRYGYSNFQPNQTCDCEEVSVYAAGVNSFTNNNGDTVYYDPQPEDFGWISYKPCSC